MRQYTDANGPGVQETVIAVTASVTAGAGVARGGPRRLAGDCRRRPRLRCSRSSELAAGEVSPDCRPALARHRLSPEAEQVWAARTESRAHALGKPQRQRRGRARSSRSTTAAVSGCGGSVTSERSSGVPSRRSVAPPTQRWPRPTSRSTRSSRLPGTRWSPTVWPRIVCAGATIRRRRRSTRRTCRLRGCSRSSRWRRRGTACGSECWSCRPRFLRSTSSRLPTRTPRSPACSRGWATRRSPSSR